LKGTWDDDRDPLAALRRGDPRLFEAFVAGEAGSLHRFFLRLGAGPHEAEDLVQEVFLKLYRSAPSYDARSAFGAYALRVARNAWIDRRRRHGARPQGRSLEDVERAGDARAGGLPAADLDPTLPAERREEVERVERALAQLSPAHAEVVELALVQGLPYARIAEVLEVPVGTVKSRVFHAVRRLRAVLEGGQDGSEEGSR
jgi:RNA polymerase sigma-70 factor (ECF subfamily)